MKYNEVWVVRTVAKLRKHLINYTQLIFLNKKKKKKCIIN